MHKVNHVRMEFDSLPENVSLARVLVASFAAQSDITISELEEIKVATSEAVSNAIIHGYQNQPHGKVVLFLIQEDDVLTIIVEDNGIGIVDIEQAMQPAYSSEPERMGLGFVFMQSFMDSLDIKSEPGKGTIITMRKKLELINNRQEREENGEA